MTNLLLGLMVILLLWGTVLREPVLQWVARRAQRRRVLAGELGAGSRIVVAPTPDESFTLLLCGDGESVEHEITRHGIEVAPESFTYAGKHYQRDAQRPDGAFVYRRVLAALVLVLVSASGVLAQGTAVTIRSSSGTELATSANPIRTDPIGSTTQPVSGTVTANQGGIWTVQPGNTANTTPWLFTPYQSGANLFINAAALADTTGNPTVTAAGAFNFLFNGTTWDRARGDTTNGLWVNCKSGCGGGAGGTSAVDNATVTESTSTFTPIGGEFQTTPGTVTTGHQAMAAITAHRALQVTLFTSAGTEITPSTDFTVGSTAPTTGPMFGGYANSAAPTAVTAGQAQYGWFDLSGRIHVTGDASMTALKVDGSAATQPVSGTVTANAGSGNFATNLAQVNGSTVSTAATGVAKVGVVGNAGAAIDAATGAAPPANAVQIAGLTSGATGGLLKAPTYCDSDFNIDITTATTTLAVTGVAGRKIHICAIVMVATATDTVALIEGTGATCGTGTAGVLGSSTAGHGMAFAANGGVSMGTGQGSVITTATTGDSLCIVTSAATQLAGHIRYAIF